MTFTPSKSVRAFSLVETALAVAILGFALVSIIGLFPVGMQTFREAMDSSVGAQIAQRVVHDCEQADFDVLVDRAGLPPDAAGHGICTPAFTFRAPKVAAPGLRYFDAQGTELFPRTAGKLTAQELAAVVYVVNVRIQPRAPLPGRKAGSALHLAQVTVEVAHSPSGESPPLSMAAADASTEPGRNLFNAPRGISVQTYAALIGRNNGR